MSCTPEQKIKLLSEIAESRRMMSAVGLSYAGENPFCLMVTSSVPGEGKSLLAAGLALGAARQGKNTILVDLNWHSPAVHTLFGVDAKNELSGLGSEKNLRALAQPSGMENLSLFTAPADMSSNQNFEAYSSFGGRILAEIKSAYELTVVDASSIFPANRRMMDPIAMAGQCNALALVVHAEVTNRQQVRRAGEYLKACTDRPVGAVVNKFGSRI